MTADHREVEDKYDLDDSTVLPDFSTLKGVRSVSTEEQQLVAIYFDTADLALAPAGVVLRRRTGGEDAGWHLKLPMDGARLEIAVPLGRAVRTPPVALRRVVAGLVREQALAQVVTIRTDRGSTACTTSGARCWPRSPTTGCRPSRRPARLRA